MNSFWRLLTRLKNYRLNVILSVVSNILMAVFTIISIPLLQPFLEILFEQTEAVNERPEWRLDLSSIVQSAQFYLSQLIEQQGRETALIYVCIAIVTTFFLKNLFRYLALFFLAPVRNGVIRDIRQQVFEKLMHLPLGYFSEERKGDIMSRITTDVQEVEASILNVLEAFFREPLIIAGALFFMIYVSPSLTVFVFILILFTAIVIGGIGRTLKKTSAVVQEKLGTLVSIIEEALSGLRIIKGFNAESYQESKFNTENNDYRHILTRLLWRRDLSSPLSEFLGISVVAVLLWYGSRLVFNGQLEASTFIVFIFAFYNVIEPAKSFSKAFYNIQKGIAAVQRVEKVLDAQSNITEQPDARPIQTLQTGITYQNVSFAYRNMDGPVLQQINLDIEKGKVIALVGPSGAGKSTLVDLLPRFFDVSEGQILIDGVDIREYKIQDLRALMGIVSQEAILFNDSIYNNIVFGKKNVSKEQVVHAAKIANAHDFITATENGYDTNIGDRGMKLSGGQRQRLTIARAILKNPPILILDEATSSLDSESEKLVQEALVQLMQERTSIVIAHRLSTIQHADEIIVLKDGRIIERGTHRRLLEKEGEYRKLVGLQAF
jgi:ABC-type multidrug transport system fused ATPase/permease subunit